jgi:hypothetical protein
VSDLVAFVAGAAGGSVGTAGLPVSRLGLGDIHLVDVPLLVLHLDRPSLGVSVPPVVVPVRACPVRVDVHWDGGVIQVAGGVGGIIPSDVGAVGLLVGRVGLCEPVPTQRRWSTCGVLVLFEHLVDEELGHHAVDCALFDFCIRVDLGGFDYVVDDGLSQSFQEVSDSCGCCEWVFGLPGYSFEVLDVLVDVGPFHLHAFYLKTCSFFGLCVLELVSEFIQEVYPDVGDVFDEWVQSVYPISLVEGPFVHRRAFDEC